MKTTLEILRITRDELKNILLGINGPTFIAMKTKTEVGMNKYTNFWIEDGNGNKVQNTNRVLWERGPVWKVSDKYRIITGFDYESSVNGRLKREGKEPNFKSEGSTWMKMLSKGLVTDKKTESKFYLRYQSLPSSTLSTEYVSDGDPIEFQMFKDYMKQKSESDNQGLDNPLMFQVCKLENIQEISVGGFHYVLTD